MKFKKTVQLDIELIMRYLEIDPDKARQFAASLDTRQGKDEPDQRNSLLRSSTAARKI